MNDVALHDTGGHLHPGFFIKLVMWATWILAGTLFFTVGWSLLAPTDPQGAVSVLARSDSVAMLLRAAALAALITAGATLLVGRQLPDAGVFSACIGMVAVSVRGETVTYFLIRRADESGALPGLSTWLLLETVAWFGVVTLMILVAYALMVALPSATMGSGRHYLTQIPSAYDLFRQKPDRLASPRAGLTPLAVGVTHCLVVTGIGLLAFRLFSSGLATRSVAHGQACFVIASAMAVGSYFAHRVAPVRSSLWGMAAALVVAVGGFLWSALTADAVSALPPSVPPSPFLRVLPIQYAAMGTATAIAMCWYMRDPDFSVERESEPAARRTPLRDR